MRNLYVPPLQRVANIKTRALPVPPSVEGLSVRQPLYIFQQPSPSHKLLHAKTPAETRPSARDDCSAVCRSGMSTRVVSVDCRIYRYLSSHISRLQMQQQDANMCKTPSTSKRFFVDSLQRRAGGRLTCMYHCLCDSFFWEQRSTAPQSPQRYHLPQLFSPARRQSCFALAVVLCSSL